MKANKTVNRYQGAHPSTGGHATASNRKEQANYLKHVRATKGRKKAALFQIREARAIRRGEGP
jgi:hypothetical protein